MAIKKKVVILGDSAVGKTSLIRRFVFDQFEDSYIATIGSKVSRKSVSIERPYGTTDLTFMIWDIVGREGYHGLHARTFVGVQGAILVADLTRRGTLETLERYWIPLLFKVVDEVPLVFVCNKSDLIGEYEFEPEEMADVASRYSRGTEGVLPKDLKHSLSTSAKYGSNVDRAFEALGHLVLSKNPTKDPVKELYESLVVTGIQRSSDTTTPVGAMDAIIADFCKGFDDSRLAMLILRQELARAGVDVNEPTRYEIHRAVEYLAEAESEFMDEDVVRSNLDRRRAWACGVSEEEP